MGDKAELSTQTLSCEVECKYCRVYALILLLPFLKLLL